MDGGDCHRACHRCGETVIDVGTLDPTEAEAFLEEHIDKAPFLDLWVRDDGRAMTKPCHPGLRRRRVVRASALALVFAAFAAAAFLLAAR